MATTLLIETAHLHQVDSLAWFACHRFLVVPKKAPQTHPPHLPPRSAVVEGLLLLVQGLEVVVQ